MEKLLIYNEDTKTSFHVQFNPTEYSFEDAAKWSDQRVPGQKPEVLYTGGGQKKLSLELFFDTYEDKSDVREHTSKVADLLIFNEETHRPPKVTISWGSFPTVKNTDFPFTCVLESLKQQFVLFLEDGTPVRAKLSCAFLEFMLPDEELKKFPKSSPDHTKAYVVKAEDTLSGIAGMFYQDPRRWRDIAKANEIDDPRKLEAGMVLTIPVIP